MRNLMWDLHSRGYYKAYTDSQYELQKQLRTRMENGKIVLTTFGLKESKEFWENLGVKAYVYVGRGYGKNYMLAQMHRSRVDTA